MIALLKLARFGRRLEHLLGVLLDAHRGKRVLVSDEDLIRRARAKADQVQEKAAAWRRAHPD